MYLCLSYCFICLALTYRDKKVANSIQTSYPIPICWTKHFFLLQHIANVKRQQTFLRTSQHNLLRNSIALAAKWLRIFSIPPNDKTRNHLVTNPINTCVVCWNKSDIYRSIDDSVNTLSTASDSTAQAHPTGISGADSPWRRLCFGLDSSIPFFLFIANGTFFELI